LDQQKFHQKSSKKSAVWYSVNIKIQTPSSAEPVIAGNFQITPEK
jgi:hypothetical protein